MARPVSFHPAYADWDVCTLEAEALQELSRLRWAIYARNDPTIRTDARACLRRTLRDVRELYAAIEHARARDAAEEDAQAHARYEEQSGR
jgi:hypothetical protein